MAEQQTFSQTLARLSAGLKAADADMRRASELGDQEGVAKFEKEFNQYATAYRQVQGQQAEKNKLIDDELASGAWVPKKEPKTEAQQPSFMTRALQSLGDTAPSVPQEIENIPDSRSALKRKLADRYEVPEENVDVEVGIPGVLRYGVAMLPDLASKDQWLRSMYGDKNVDLRNINGRQSFLVRVGNKVSLVDEYGSSGKDFTDLASEVFPTLAGLAAVRGGGLVKGAAKTNLAAQGVGVLQDAIAQSFLLPYEEDTFSLSRVTPGAIAKKRLFEAGTGFVLETALGGIGRYAARKLTPSIANRVATEEIAAVERLRQQTPSRKQTFDVNPSPGVIRGAGEAGMERMQASAVLPFGGKLKAAFSKNLDALNAFKEAAEGKMPDKATVFQSGLDRIYAVTDSLAKSIKTADRTMRGVLDREASRRLKSLQVDRDVTEIGKGYIDMIKGLEIKQDELKNELFKEAYAALDDAGVTVTQEELLQELYKSANNKELEFFETGGIDTAIAQIEAQLSKAQKGKEAAARAADIRRRMESRFDTVTPEEYGSLKGLDDLAAEGADYLAPFPIRSIDNLRKRIEQTVPFGGPVATGNTSAVVADKAGKALDKLIEKKLSNPNLDPKLKQLYDKAYDDYIQKRLPYEVGPAGYILRQEKGQMVATPQEAVGKLFGDPTNVSNFIEVVRGTDPKQVPGLLKSLQEGYMAKLGLTADRNIPKEGFQYNEEVFRNLFGRNADGTPNPTRAVAAKAAMDELNATLKAKNAKLVDIEDMSKFLEAIPDALDQKTRTTLVKMVADKSQLLEKSRKMMDNKIIDFIVRNKGLGEEISPSDFANAMLRAEPSQVKQVMRSLTPQEATSARTAMSRWLFQEYPATYEQTQLTGAKLWDPDKFLADFRGNTKLKDRMEAAFGKEFTKDFEAASTVLRNSRLRQRKPFMDIVRGTADPTSGNVNVYVAAKASDYLLNPIYAAAYGSNRLQPLLRFIHKNPDPVQLTRRVNATTKSVLSSAQGVKFLMEMAQDDPRETSYLMDALGSASKTEQDLMQRYNTQK